MNLLYIVGGCYDFGVDYLYDGLRVLGHHVIEWPMQPHYHRPGEDGAHWINWPCEFIYPEHGMDEDAILAALRVGWFDCAILTTLRDRAPDTARRLLAGTTGPIITTDFYDERRTREEYERVLGRSSVTHFVREHPHEGEQPLPFAFPMRWGCPPGTHVRSRRAYFCGSEITPLRKAIIGELPGLLPPDTLQLRSYGWMDKPLVPVDYLSELRHAAIAIVPAGGGWDTSRLWEAAASGCALVVQRPPYSVPQWFGDHQVCEFTTIPEAAAHITRLLSDDEELQDRAIRTYAHFRSHHTTQQRAAGFLRALAAVGIQ